MSEREGQPTTVDDLFRSALDAMVDLVVIESAIRDDAGHVVDFRIDYMNPVNIDVAGRPRDELIGRSVLELYPAMSGSELFALYVEVAETGESRRVAELPYQDEINGEIVTGYYAVHLSPFGDGLLIVSRDISDERRHAEHLERVNEQLSAAQHLAHIGIWDLDLVRRSVTFSDELRSIFGLPSDGSLPALEQVIENFIHPDDQLTIQSIVLDAPNTRAPFTVDVRVRPIDGGERTLVVFGTVQVDEAGNPERLWGTAQDVTELRNAELALLDSTALLEHEHGVVATLQEILQPELPHLAELELAAVYLPAGGEALVGGDWYDAFVLDDDQIVLTVGDVAGRGLPAAALMSQLRNALRGASFAGRNSSDTLVALNRLVASTTQGEMATCLCTTYFPSTGALELTSAGHPPPLVIEPGRPSTFVDVHPSPPLGVPADDYAARTIVLPPGATVVLYTDGLIEARGFPIDEGLDRLRRSADELGHLPVGELCEAVSMAMFEGRERADDVCILVARTASRATP